MENGVVVPLLDLPALEKTPRGTLASKADFLRLLWGYVDGNFVGFRGKPHGEPQPVVLNLSCWQRL